MNSEKPKSNAGAEGPNSFRDFPFGKDLSPERFRFFLLLLFVLGLIVRAGFLLEHAGSPSFGVVTLDQKYYDTAARMLLAGEDLHLLRGLRPLLYPMFLAGLYKVGGAHGMDLAIIAQHLLGIGTRVLVALLGARLFRHRLSGLVGGILYMLAPVPLYFEGEFLIEPFYIFLIFLALLLHLRAAEADGWKSHALWFLGGAFTVLIAQARANILIFMAVYPLLAGWRWWGSRKANALWPLLGLLGGLAMAIPWGFVNKMQSDHFQVIPSAGGVNLYLGNKHGADGMVVEVSRRVNYSERYEDSVEVWAREEYEAAMRAQGRQPVADPMAISHYWTARAVAEIKADPAAWLRLMAKKCWLTLWNAEVPNNKAFAFLQQEFFWLRALPVRWVVLLMFAPAGIWAAGKWGNREALFIVLIYAFLYLGTNLAFFICDRYRYPVWPALAALGGGGLLVFLQTIRLKQWGNALGLGLSMALMAALSLHNWFGAKLPNFARDYFFHSIAWYEKGHFPEALADIDQSIELDPSDASALHHRGNVLLALNRMEDARKEFEQTLQRIPEDAGVWNNLGVALEGLSQTNEADAAFRRAIQCHPPSKNAFLSLIFGQIHSNHLDEAAALLDRIDQQSHEPDAVALALHSVLSRRRGDASQAGLLEQQARALDAGAASWAIERANGGSRRAHPDQGR